MTAKEFDYDIDTLAVAASRRGLEVENEDDASEPLHITLPNGKTWSSSDVIKSTGEMLDARYMIVGDWDWIDADIQDATEHES